jgi:hypothetical protein
MATWILVGVATFPALWGLGATNSSSWRFRRKAAVVGAIAVVHSATVALILALTGRDLFVGTGTGVCVLVAELLTSWAFRNIGPPRTENGAKSQ